MITIDDVRLDNPVYAALTGAQAPFAQTRGRVVRYRPDVGPFFAFPSKPSLEDWADAVHLVPPGTYAAHLDTGDAAPDPWTAVDEFDVAQMVAEEVLGTDDPEAILLGPADVPEMLELVRQTNPGPFLNRTIELGRYLGIRREGVLVAMAGERMHFAGWREISAVCTAPTHRGQGLATRLIGAIGSVIHGRSEKAFLHVLTTNAGAIALYDELGFSVRTTRTITVVTPGPA
jgi:ribosomal protein S18 acetylase RimI-like enzyme